MIILKQLNESENRSGYISDDTKIKLNISTLKEAVKAMFFLAASSKKPTSGVSPEKRHPEVDQKIKVIRFTKEETIQIDLNAPKLGRLRILSFYGNIKYASNVGGANDNDARMKCPQRKRR